MVSLQIPILFDISAAGVVFGEDVSGVDIFDAHLKFQLDTSAGGPASKIKTVFQNILYADASENDVSGVLFYYNETNSATAISASDIAEVIQAAILNGKLKQSMAAQGAYGSAGTGSAGSADSDPSSNPLAGDWVNRYQAPGIPLPMYGVTSRDSTSGPATGQQYYTDAICDSGGTNFGRVLIRLMATSLMGHPFAQGFIKNESQIMKDISDCDISTQLGDNLFKGYYFGDHDDGDYPKNRDISGVAAKLGAAESSGPNAFAYKSAGIHNGILQQIYEQLLGSAPERFDLSNNGGSSSYYVASDASDNDTDAGKVYPNRLPIRDGDTISFYFRPRVQISMDTDAAAGVSASKVSDSDDVQDDGVENEGDVASSYAAQNTTLGSIFFQPRHRWISHRNDVTINTANGELAEGSGGTAVAATEHLHCDGKGNLRMEGTNLIADDNNKLFFDAHVWRILCTIPSA